MINHEAVAKRTPMTSTQLATQAAQLEADGCFASAASWFETAATKARLEGDDLAVARHLVAMRQCVRQIKA